MAGTEEEFADLELLKSVTPMYLEEESRVEAVLDMPKAVIPEGLGHSQVLPRYYQSVIQLQRYHLSSTSKTTSSHSHRYSTAKSPPNSRPPSLPPSYRPATSMRSHSATKKDSFLSYLLTKTSGFSLSKPSPSPNITRFSGLQRPTSLHVSYMGDYRGDDKEGEGEAKYRNGDLYRGSWVQGKRHGYGEFHYKGTGMVYQGEWTNGLKHGRGTVLFPNGDKLDCLWNKDLLEDGKGTIDYLSIQCKYTGELKAGKQHGQGCLVYSSNTSYKGGFQEDRRHGSGCLQTPNGCMFEGRFEYDYTTSPGLLHLKCVLTLKTPSELTMTSTKSRGVVWSLETKQEKFGQLHHFPQFASQAPISNTDIIYRTLTTQELCSKLGLENSTILSGQFKSGALNGAGMAVYGDFGEYVGEFKDGMRSGYGRMRYANEDMECLEVGDTVGEYEGLWKLDKRHGRGKMMYKNGIVCEGQYRQDRRHNVTGSVSFPSGDRYTGQWGNDLMHGLGKFSDANGTVVTGMFVQGRVGKEACVDMMEGGKYEGQVSGMKPEGRGRWTYGNGDVYIGKIVDGMRSGPGKMMYHDGSVYEGEWREGLREGWGLYHTSEEIYEGYWSKDHKHGKGVLRNSVGQALYDGWWRDGVKEGKGTACD